MMDTPLWLKLGFICITLITALWFYRITRKRLVLAALAILLMLSGLLGYSGVLDAESAVPPRIPLLILPAIIIMFLLFFTKYGKSILDNISYEMLTYIHVVRIPVEFGILTLFTLGLMPESMTFEGRNFDIFSGITAPFIAYFGYHKSILPKWTIAAWNVVCLILVLQVVITGILAAPSVFQIIEFNQPNIAVLYFPYVWLPAIIVPIVVTAHLASLRQLYRSTSQYKSV